MARRNDDLSEIVGQMRIERQALFAPVAEISRRLQPHHLVEVTTRYAKDKMVGAVGGVSDAIKQNGGTVAAVALGAVAVFDAGRKSAEGASGLVNASEPHVKISSGGKHTGRLSVPNVGSQRKGLSNVARAKVLAGSAGGLLIGHVIGRSFKATGKERELFGKAAEELQSAASEFVSLHSRGAKLAAAQSFGFARYSAAFLVLMAVAGDYFGGSKDGGNQD
ncbi:hypothetical protein [Mesorhizobium carmichaelinearum]|uniref:hypothetical protein n=1 Tax=Mesorhizobium carmichaelinearum TaxID=1208188 RepID=UPI000BA466AC|nr:hypothetical protein [Mesorhizobium carmichaelinearum]